MSGFGAVKNLGLILLVMMLMIPSATAGSGDGGSDLELVVTLAEPTSGAEWYSGDEPVSITMAIRNNGDVSEAVDYNPSCPVEISMLDANGALFSNLREHRTCLSQRRAIDIAAGQMVELDTFEWNWQNSEGELLPSGDSLLQFDFEAGTSVASESIVFLRSAEILGDLDLVADSISPLGGDEFGAGESLLVHLSLVNSGTTEMTIDVESGCRVMMTASSATDSFPPVLTDLGCGTGETLGVGDSLSLGWFSWDFTDSDGFINPGEWTSQFSLTGIAGAETNVVSSFAMFESPVDTSLAPTLGIQTDLNDGVVSAGEGVMLTTSLTNPDNYSHHLRFNDSCLVIIRMYSESGLLMSDSRTDDGCEEAITETKVDPLAAITLDERSWSMADVDGCELEDGSYLMVVDVPELDLQTRSSLLYDGDDSGAECRASLQDTSLVSLSVIALDTYDAGTLNETVEFQLRFENQVDIDMFWTQTCQLQFRLQRFGEVTPYRVWFEACDNEQTGLDHIVAGEGIGFGPFSIGFGELPAGLWHLTATTTGSPSLSTQWAHTWKPPAEESEQTSEETGIDDSTPESPAEEATLQSWMAEGTWKYATTDEGGCWLLRDAAGDDHTYTTTTVTDWSPKPFTEGAYWVEENPTSSAACAGWDSHLTVTQVLGEREVTPTVNEQTGDLEHDSPVVTVPVSAPAIVAVVATTGLFAALAAALMNVEWIRLPATKYGLALIGMVKRKKENGGEYQRGRIVAYIELHRGIHFRALLSALGMSNGQLTHHLSVLVSDERVWRRKDGRKVRFYPASIDSSTSEEDLPVPVLTPDPDSLQGKILQMLDIHENEYLNLSQKELSDKLETSQQLVSYHLKSLEKWGLVEKERVAMRYRYRLTNRALVLINTGDFPSLGEDF